MVIGSTIMPLSDRFTLSTSPACCSMLRLRWMIPIPPCWAMAIAICPSVTVSIAALSKGTFRAIVLVTCVCVETVAGTTSERPGSNKTSSKVSASGTGK